MKGTTENEDLHNEITKSAAHLNIQIKKYFKL
jgi:hypothetical protein